MRTHGRVPPDLTPPSGETGAAAVGSTVVIALSMVLFVLCANAVVVMYGRGVVRGALDEGVRYGARPSAGADACLARIEDVLGQLLSGTMGDRVGVNCIVTDDAVVATADLTFVDWLTGEPRWRAHLSARAIRRAAPS